MAIYNTSVELMAGVPLDPDYRHTITWASRAAQTSYFTSKVISNQTIAGSSQTQLSYQRHNAGSMRVQSSMVALGNCNYMRFYNHTSGYPSDTSKENRYFYAFVLDIRYVNEKTVDIIYKIDVLQTWYFDYTVNQCFVVREHTNDDHVGYNRVPEGLETGDYVSNGSEFLYYWDKASESGTSGSILPGYLVVATQGPEGQQNSKTINNVYNIMYTSFCYGNSALETLLAAYAGGTTASYEPIISISQFPSIFWDSERNDTGNITVTLQHVPAFGFNGFSALDPSTGLMKTYVPHNNKLYTSPYNFLTVQSPSGSTQNLKYEDFRNLDTIQFFLLCATFPQVEIVCLPYYYENSTQILNPRYALYANNFPTVGVASDAYSAWWAQNKNTMPIALATIEGEKTNVSQSSSNSVPEGMVEGDRIDQRIGRWLGDWYNRFTAEGGRTSTGLLIGKGLEAGIDIATGNLNGAISDAENALMELATVKNHLAVPDTVATQAGASSVLHYLGMDSFMVHYTKIRPEMAEIIDQYFDCYGYATNKVKVPNITGRPYWNYVQTKNCTISGNVPQEVESEIAAIFDRGLTFWHNTSYIKDYSQDNRLPNYNSFLPNFSTNNSSENTSNSSENTSNSSENTSGNGGD